MLQTGNFGITSRFVMIDYPMNKRCIHHLRVGSLARACYKFERQRIATDLKLVLYRDFHRYIISQKTKTKTLDSVYSKVLSL